MFLDTCIYSKSIKMHESDKYQVQGVISGVGGSNRLGKGVKSGTWSVSLMPSFLKEKSKASEAEYEDLTVFFVYRYLLFSIFSIRFKYFLIQKLNLIVFHLMSLRWSLCHLMLSASKLKLNTLVQSWENAYFLCHLVLLGHRLPPKFNGFLEVHDSMCFPDASIDS